MPDRRSILLTLGASAIAWIVLGLLMAGESDDGVLDAGGAAPIETIPIDIMTFNIRTSLGQDGPNSWPNRKELVAETIRRYGPALVGMQEALREQIDYLDEALPAYRWIGIDRGLNGGTGLSEATPIFYRFSEFSPIESGTFWLSSTPAQPTAGRRPSRIATWARFYHHNSGAELYVFNTHLTMRRGHGQLASVRQILARIDALPDGTTTILTGDFNSMAGASATWHEATTGGLADAWLEASRRIGPPVTWSGFAGPRDRDNRIDWILVRGRVDVESIETVVHSDGLRFPSDHFPVYARLAVPARNASAGSASRTR